jgi:hypothetical protein
VKSNDKNSLFTVETIRKRHLGVKGKIDHNMYGFKVHVHRGDCECLKRWEAADVIAQLIGRNYSIHANFGQTHPLNPVTIFKNHEKYASMG